MPEDFPLSPAVLRLLRDFARESGADGVTLWKARDAHLAAVANPLEPGITGIRQPLDSGLVSQVYLTGQAILEEKLAEHPAHDPAIDRILGKRCRSLMAAPVEAGDGGGVVSAVVFDGRPHGFVFADLGKLVALARRLGNLVEEEGW